MARRIVLTIVCAAFAWSEARPQAVTSAVPFLLIAPNSRAAGMGESGVANADDAWAIFWNPAGYAFQSGSEVALTRADWLPAFGLSDLWIAHGVYKQPMEEVDGIVAAGITYLSLGEFNHTKDSPTIIDTWRAYEFAITLGYGTLLGEHTGIGINARLIHSSLAPFGAGVEQGSGIATGFSFDLGVLYKPASLFIPFTDVDLGSTWTFGASLTNVGPKLTYIDQKQADPLPLNLRLGMSYSLINDQYNSLSFELDLNRLLIRRDSTQTDEFYQAFFTTWTQGGLPDQLRQFVVSAGAEYWYGSPRLFALRAGYFYEDPNAGNRKFMTFGAGLRHDIYGFDFSYISAFEDQHPLGETLRFSLSILWGGPTVP